MASREFIFLGTGTSVGVPMVGCGCAVCRSPDPHNQRYRTSALLRLPTGNLLIDTGPDMATECGVFAGIHTARSGGTTHTPCFVRSVITPLEANNNWSSG